VTSRSTYSITASQNGCHFPSGRANKVRNIKASIPEVTTRYYTANWGILTVALRLSSAFRHGTVNPFKSADVLKNDDALRTYSKAKIKSLNCVALKTEG
jgi:hypothetical protein